MSVNPGPKQVGERPDLSALRMQRDAEPAVRRRRGLGWLIVLVLLVAVVVVAIRLPVPWLLPRIETATVQALTPTQASTVLTATGYTYARTRAAVGARIIGRVVELRVDEGDRVSVGDVIVVLDSEDLEAAVYQGQAAVGEAEARLVDAERELRRQQRMFDAEVSPEADLDAAQTRLEIAAAQLRTAEARLISVEAQLAYTVIESPIDGVVIERNIEVGEMVAPGGFTSQQSTGSIVRIADPSSLEVEADINESYISRITLGQPATIRVDAVPDVDYHGRLRQIVPTADRQRAVVEVKVTVDDGDDRLVPDMSCTVTFLAEGTGTEELSAAPKLLVPGSAVLRQGNSTWVQSVRDGRLQRLEVLVSDEPVSGEEGLVEVLSGVVAGETIARTADASLEDGQRVRVEKD